MVFVSSFALTFCCHFIQVTIKMLKLPKLAAVVGNILCQDTPLKQGCFS